MTFLFVGLVLLALIGMRYNTLVQRRNRSENAFSGIDVQLKRRADLVPNLVETVKAYAAHEAEVFQRVTAARAASSTPRAPRRAPPRVQRAGRQIARVVALAEDYPELKADAKFEKLMRTLTEIESQVSAARRTFNAAVNDYNNGVETFLEPHRRRLRLRARAAYFEIDPSAQSRPPSPWTHRDQPRPAAERCPARVPPGA